MPVISAFRKIGRRTVPVLSSAGFMALDNSFHWSSLVHICKEELIIPTA
jgi:hypothetical protein